MIFNLNEFLMSVSFTLDFIEMDLFGRALNHSKRVAYIALKLGQKLGLNRDEMSDMVALSILHDNGVGCKILHEESIGKSVVTLNSIETRKEHCIIGEENVMDYPFLTDVRDVIRYHHEKYDGSGFFGLKGNEIPDMSQVIELADSVEINFDLINASLDTRKNIYDYVSNARNKSIGDKIADAFLEVSSHSSFWLELKGEFLNDVLLELMPEYALNMSMQDIHKITHVFSKLIDSKSKFTQEHSSGLADKINTMAGFYGIPEEEKMKLIIAADLHDIGKLAVPNSILDSNNKLTEEEFEIIKEHTYYTRMSLRGIKGFEEITEWASNHHEKLNGSGYPYGKSGGELDFNSRLMACLDIYQALTERRPYRSSLNHEVAMSIMSNMVSDGEIDESITRDIDSVFGQGF